MATYTVAPETMSETIARAIAKFPQERARIERGALLVLLGHVEATGPDTFAVKSQMTPASQSYVVTVDWQAHWAVSCSCPDAQHRSERNCKHGWAATLLMVARERQWRQDRATRYAILSDAEIAALSAWKREYSKTSA